MALGLIDSNYLTNIANAIRGKLNVANNYYPSEMPDAINNISGGNADLGTKSITSNGIYNAADDSLDGYNSVTVAVPMPTYNSDILNVSVNGTYNAAQSGLDGFSEVNVNVPVTVYNSAPLSVTVNGTYNASDNGLDGFNSVTVAVPSGGGGDTEDFISVVDSSGNPIGIDNFGLCATNFMFNEPIKIGNRVTNCAGFFSGGAYSFNQPVNIPDSVLNCSKLFYGTSMNSNVRIGNNVIDCSQMFSGCLSFNKPVVMPDSVTNCYEMFNYCFAFNQPITIPNNVTNCANMFQNCNNFNQPITIPNNVTDCAYMFSNCNLLNQDIVIPEGVINCYYMFCQCHNFTKTVTIANSVTACGGLFASSNNRPTEIYVKNVQSTFQFDYAFSTYDTPNDDMTIYTDAESMEVLKNTNFTSWQPLTWDSNNYNSQYKIKLEIGSRETYLPSAGQYNNYFAYLDNGVIYRRTTFNYPITSQSIDSGNMGNTSAINTAIFNNIYSIDGGTING